MDNIEALTYAQETPDVAALKDAYDRTISDLGWYFDSTRDSYDYRRNIWTGKSKDQRKHGADAFPWEGAADTEVHLIDDCINTYVALFMSSLGRANIRAYPVEMSDIGRARVVSAFLKWMVASYIPDFRRQMELGANYLLERGLMVTYVGWQKEDRTFLQKLDINQIAQMSPDLAKIILDGGADDKLITLFQQQFPATRESRLKKALKQLRKEGVAEIPVVRQSVNCPMVQALAPDGDVFFPAYTIDPNKSPYCFWRVLMTAQEIMQKVATEGWSEEWAKEVIEKAKGGATNEPRASYSSVQRNVPAAETNELYEVVYCYQRLISDEDGSEGIYCTVFHPTYIGKPNEQLYAKRELLNGYDNYPFVVTKLGEDNKRLYELATIPGRLIGNQNNVKVERDSRIDRNSLATVPPIMHPAGNPPADWGPKAYVPYRRMGEFQFGPVPQYNPGSVEIERTLLEETDKQMGLSPENPLSAVKQQWFVDKFLCHVRDVLRLAFKCYQRFGPEEVFFRVTGSPDPIRFGRGDPDENFDIQLDFDVLMRDPENMEKQLTQFASLIQFDRNGRINMDRLLEAMAASINPLLADAVLQPAEAAQQQVVKQVTDDLSKIYAGIEVGARPNGAQIAMQTIQQYTQQPDVMERLNNDEAFRGRLEKYVQQYAFQLQQAQNAQIGKIGTAPAQMGEMQTQGVTQ